MTWLFTLITALVVAVPGQHVGFPTLAQYNGQRLYAYRDGSGHMSGGGEAVLSTWDGQELLRLSGTWDCGPGKMAATSHGLVYPTVDMWWQSDGIHATTTLHISQDLESWQNVQALQFGRYVYNFGRPFEFGDVLIVPLYVPGPEGASHVLLAAYDWQSWSVWGEIVPDPGDTYNEASVIVLPSGDWLAAIRANKADNIYNYWIALARSSDNGKTWTVERTTIPGQAAMLLYDNGLLYMTFRGWGGTSIVTSRDLGATWATGYVIERSETGDCAYADMMIDGPWIRLIWYSDSGTAISTTALRRQLHSRRIPIVRR